MSKFIFICFMYGTAFPIVWLIALLALLNIYATDKLLLVKWYKAPPNYDKFIVMRAIRMLSKAPLLFVLFGYWTVSNPL